MTTDVSQIPASATADRSVGKFVRHFLEMVVAMVLGMLVLGGLVTLGFALLGHSSLYHYTALRALIMSVNMTVGMSIWMRYRGHNWLHIGEMAGAMLAPLALLVYPFWAGLLSSGALLSGMHLLMFPSMLGLMFYRRDLYARDHNSHSSPHAHAAPHAGVN